MPHAYLGRLEDFLGPLGLQLGECQLLLVLLHAQVQSFHVLRRPGFVLLQTPQGLELHALKWTHSGRMPAIGYVSSLLSVFVLLPTAQGIAVVGKVAYMYRVKRSTATCADNTWIIDL